MVADPLLHLSLIGVYQTERRTRIVSLIYYVFILLDALIDNISRIFTFQHHLDNSKNLTGIQLAKYAFPYFKLILLIPC